LGKIRNPLPHPHSVSLNEAWGKISGLLPPRAAVILYNSAAHVFGRNAPMKWFGSILLLLTLASPACATNRITVQQLKDLLVSLQQAKKTDVEVAVELKQIELTEELTKSTLDSMASLVPGPLTTQQVYALEASSAVLAPPAIDLPSTPAPDAAAQSALLAKAVASATVTYAHLPHLTATKTTYRFQNRIHAPIATNQGKLTDEVWTDPRTSNGSQFIYYVGATEARIESLNGTEIPSKVKDKTLWGANGQMAVPWPGPALDAIAQEAQTAGTLKWLRWETVDDRQTAVFSFAVEKKKSHYTVNYCCFPNTDQAGETGNRGAEGGGIFSGSIGNMHSYTNWSPYKATVPYHGEVFIDSDTGIVVRLVTQAEFKPSDNVHREDQRIDYGAVTVNDKKFVVPLRTFIDTEVAAEGKNAAGQYSTRRTLFALEYKDYQLADAAAQK
jgi:hypothetical protein